MSASQRPSGHRPIDQFSALVAAQPLLHCWLACARSPGTNHLSMVGYERRTLRLRHTTVKTMAPYRLPRPVHYASFSRCNPELKRGSRREWINRSSTFHRPVIIRGSLHFGARRDYRTRDALSRQSLDRCGRVVRVPAVCRGRPVDRTRKLSLQPHNCSTGWTLCQVDHPRIVGRTFCAQEPRLHRATIDAGL
jgi:hypothetical protein